MTRWRVVVRQFKAKADSKEPPTHETFDVGEKLFVRNDNGVHVSFVRQRADHEPFSSRSDTFAAATEACDSPGQKPAKGE